MVIERDAEQNVVGSSNMLLFRFQQWQALIALSRQDPTHATIK